MKNEKIITNNENTICEAGISYKRNKVLMIIWYVIAAFLFISGSSESGHHTEDLGRFTYENYKLQIWWQGIYEKYTYGDDVWHSHFDKTKLIIAIIITAAVILLPIIVQMITKKIANGCSIYLTNDKVLGTIKKLFSEKELNMPIEKIDNIMVSQNIFDKMTRTETIIISSNSGKIAFHYVHNAPEFVEKTVSQIEMYKKSIADKKENAPTRSDNPSITEQLTELQNLKNSGIICNIIMV